jgi:hypothetical protein
MDRPTSVVPPDALTPFTRDASVDHYLQVIERAAPTTPPVDRSAIS